MKLHEIRARRAAIADELRKLDPTAEGAQATIDQFDAELATLDRRQRVAELLDTEDRKAEGKPVERRGTMAADAVAIRSDQTWREWQETRTGQPVEQLSIGNAVRAIMTGRRDGAEAEFRAMTSSIDSAGGFAVPEPMLPGIMDAVRAASVFVQAGAQTIPMTSSTMRVVQVASDPVPAFRAEAAAIAESDGSFQSVLLNAFSLGVLVKVSAELLDDAPGFAAALDTQLAAAMALKIDWAALYGTGSGMPLGLRGLSQAAEQTMGANGAAMTDYDKVLDLLQSIREANGNPTTAIMAPRTQNKLAKLTTGISGDKTKLTPPADFTALRRLVSNQVSITEEQGSSNAASTLFAGDFTQAALALRQGVTIEATRVADDAFSKNMVHVRALARFDIAWFRPTHFGRLIGVL